MFIKTELILNAIGRSTSPRISIAILNNKYKVEGFPRLYDLPYSYYN